MNLFFKKKREEREKGGRGRERWGFKRRFFEYIYFCFVVRRIVIDSSNRQQKISLQYATTYFFIIIIIIVYLPYQKRCNLVSAPTSVGIVPVNWLFPVVQLGVVSIYLERGEHSITKTTIHTQTERKKYRDKNTYKYLNMIILLINLIHLE